MTELSLNNLMEACFDQLGADGLVTVDVHKVLTTQVHQVGALHDCVVWNLQLEKGLKDSKLITKKS